jgi:hypothetical protein
LRESNQEKIWKKLWAQETEDNRIVWHS